MCFLHLITGLVKAHYKHADHAEHLLAMLGEPELTPVSSPVPQASGSVWIIVYSMSIGVKLDIFIIVCSTVNKDMH